MRPETSSRFDSAGWHGKDRHATKLSIVPEGKADDDIADLSCTARTDQPDIVRWYSLYRKAFPWAGITCPAEAVRLPAVAKWVKKHGYAIDVRSSDELTLAISADIPPARIIMHDDGATAGPIRRAVNVGVGRFVIGSSQQRRRRSPAAAGVGCSRVASSSSAMAPTSVSMPVAVTTARPTP